MSARTGAAGGTSPVGGEMGLEFIGQPPERVFGLFTEAVAEAERAAWVERIWDRDASLWAKTAAEQEAIAGRLGWLRAPDDFLDAIEDLEAFAGASRDVFRGAVLAGMGGSSLAPALLVRTAGPGEQGMPVAVLDSTDPAAVAAIDRDHPPAETLYLIATKSGTTTETLAFLAHFLERAERDLAPLHGGLVERAVEAVHRGPERWIADHFAAITDPDESVERIPYSARFREVFLNPPDVGGRYSALTYVGLVPAALLGLDLRATLVSAIEMAERCRAPQADRNPGLALGLLMGSLGRAGVDKLTLVVDPPIAALGPWIEQLVAESTGKGGTGIVPVDDEPLGPPDVYGPDRLFVRIVLRDGGSRSVERALARLAAAGHPVVSIRFDDLQDLGGEFFRWEFATAVAGAVLGVNAFDEPDVTESKRNTERVLRERPAPRAGIAASDPALAEILARHLERLHEHGYLALTAFVAPAPERDAALGRLRLAVRDATRRATTVGYGPRYLHSTGQLHKGGAPIGWFLQLVAGHRADLPVPGRGYTFGTLIDAQAEGDLAALEAHGLPVLRVHLGDDPDGGLAALESALVSALAGRPRGAPAGRAATT